MRTIDERVAVVQRRSKRLRRRRGDRALAVLIIVLALPLVDLVGRHAAGGSAHSASGSGLFGATSLFGPSIGGYVLVAIVSAAVAVLAVTLVFARRKARRGEAGTPVSGEAINDHEEF